MYHDKSNEPNQPRKFTEQEERDLDRLTKLTAALLATGDYSDTTEEGGKLDRDEDGSPLVAEDAADLLGWLKSQVYVGV